MCLAALFELAAVRALVALAPPSACCTESGLARVCLLAAPAPAAARRSCSCCSAPKIGTGTTKRRSGSSTKSCRRLLMSGTTSSGVFRCARRGSSRTRSRRLAVGPIKTSHGFPPRTPARDGHGRSVRRSWRRRATRLKPTRNTLRNCCASQKSGVSKRCGCWPAASAKIQGVVVRAR